MKNPYEILGVPKTATQNEIKKAYRNLAKLHHPDLNPGKKAAEAKFKEINDANAMIGEAESRAKYDRGETTEQAQAKANESYYRSQQSGGRYAHSFGGGFDEEDLFANLFGGGAGGRGGRRKPQAYQGEDQLFQMEVELRDAALGAEKEITLPTGKTLAVKIPAGIEDGTKLRFKGHGGPGINGGPNGDAFVKISIKPMAGFNRVGNNIETEVEISFQEGILGAELRVPTLDGQVMLKINPGVSTGSKLRIRGKGAGAGSTKGDQIVVIKVVLPAQVDPELQAAIKEWGDRFQYMPRRGSL